MKRILLTLSFAALALSGCIQDELLDNGGGSETAAVEFGTYLGRSAQTRATVITSETLKGEGFGVNAWYTGLESFNPDSLAAYDVFMNNTRVAHDGTAWAYSPLKYWPNNPNEMVSFVAYAPYNMVTAADGTVSAHPNINVSGTDVTYTVANEVKDQVDLLWSDSNESDDYKTIDLKKQTVDDKVTFYFKHALSKVSFKVGALIDMVEDDTTDGELGSEVLAPETVIKVRKVVLMGGSDTYSETEGWLTDGDGPFYTGGTLSLMDGTWSDLKAGQRFEFTAEEHFIVDDNKEFVLDQNNSNELNELLTDDSYLMIIPQDLTTGGFKIYIEYDVITTDSAATDGSVVVKNRITSADAITSIDFDQGKQYNINMILGMTTVKFDVEVSEWIPADDENSDNPANKNEETALTQAEMNALLIASRFAGENVATVNTADGKVTFMESYPLSPDDVADNTYFSISTFNDVNQVFSDGNGNNYRLPTAGEFEMLVPADGVSFGYDNDDKDANLTSLTETVYLENDKSLQADKSGESVSGQSVFKVTEQTSDSGSNVTYALRFKGSGQYAAYRYEFTKLQSDGTNTLYALKVQMKALKADDVATTIDMVSESSYWNQDFVQVILPGLYMKDSYGLWYGDPTSYGTACYYLSTTLNDSGINYLLNGDINGGVKVSPDYRDYNFPIRMIFCNEDGTVQ